MKNTNKIIIGILLAVIIVGSIFYFLRKPDESNKVIVRLKWLNQAQFAGFYFAKEANFYKDAGLDVTINPGGVDFPAVQMVTGGSEQFGVTAADQLLLAREKGIPVVCLAVIYRKSPVVYFAKKSSNIKVPKDFIGKKVGVKLGGNEELTYRAMLKSSGVNSNNIKEEPVKYDMTPFFNDDIAVWPGYVINEAILCEEKGIPINIIWPNEYGVNMYADAIFTTEQMIKDHPDIVRKFVKATLKGWEAASKNLSQAVNYTLKYGDKLTKDHETKMLKASIQLLKPNNRPIGTMDKARWEEMQKLLLAQGFMKTPVNIDQVFTNDFLPKE